LFFNRAATLEKRRQSLLIDFAVFFTSELIDRVNFFFVTLLKIGTKKYLHLTGGLAQAGQ